MTPQFKVGDKAVVSHDLAVKPSSHYLLGTNATMRERAGEVVTIKKGRMGQGVGVYIYTLEGSPFNWTAEMLVPLEDK